LRIKGQGMHLTHNEHDDDDDFITSWLSSVKNRQPLVDCRDFKIIQN